MRRALEHLTGPSIETAARLEDRLDPASMMSTTNRHVEAHHVRPWRLGLVTQRDGPGANERAEFPTLSERRVRRGRRDRSQISSLILRGPANAGRYGRTTGDTQFR